MTSDRDQLWLIGSPGAGRTECVAEVALKLRVFHTYTFSIPEHLRTQVVPGAAVRVPAARGNRLIDGWCLRVSESPWDNTRRAVDSVTNAQVLLTPTLIDLLLWMSNYYACPPGKTLEAVLPAAARRIRRRQASYLRRAGTWNAAQPTAARRAVFDALESGPLLRSTLRLQTGASPGLLRAMINAGLLEIEMRSEALCDLHRAPGASKSAGKSDVEFCACPEDELALTPGQRDAIAAVENALADGAGFGVQLLFGVPGSGKSEVYVRSIRAAVERGRQAIVLVPEIALATQIVQRFARRFRRVAVLHSRLKATKRVAVLEAIRTGAVDVVIGTRSAVFAPFSRLGLIVVDEEQEGSFKSMSAPLYHARDVAIKRAQLEKIPILLGSATPALETWHNAVVQKRFSLLRLAERVPGAQLPRVAAIDLRREHASIAVLSRELREALRETLAAGQQAILLHNRRGYAAHLRCMSCGLAVRCPRCAAHLIEHRERQVLKCHRCGTVQPIPAHCLDNTCRGELERTGLAIQKLEEEVRQTFPSARLVRLDRDTMRKREDYAAALGAFERRDADILLGTQMVAKGLDFPTVKLVGVLDADAMLNLPDFRAAEHGFQLLTQVVGRAGRKQGDSLALIQCQSVENPVLQFALRLDYESFAYAELSIRRKLGYPPFGRLLRFICKDPKAEVARGAAESLAGSLRDLACRVSAAIGVHDAQACQIPRLRSVFRWEVVVQTPRSDAGQQLLREAISRRLFSTRAKGLTIDVDPVEMM